MPGGVGTGGAQGSDGRGDRRQRGRMEGRRVRRDEGEEEKSSSEAEWTRGESTFGGEGSERTPSFHLTTLHVRAVWCVVNCARGGRRVVARVMANRLLHSKTRKKKALATHHLS